MARKGRALWAVLVVLIVLAVGADIAARLVVQNLMAEKLQTELVLEQRPDVSLHGWPFLLHFARERFPSADIEAENVEESGLRIRRLLLHVENVRFSTRSGVVEAGRGTGTAEVTDRALNRLLESEGVPAELRFSQGKVSALAEVAGTQVEVGGTLRIDRSLLTFEPQGEDVPSGLELQIQLPAVIGQVEYTDLTIEDDVAVLTIELAGSLLRAEVET